MKLALTQFVTLDGVSQGPGSPTEDTSDGFDRGGWLVPHLDEVFVQMNTLPKYVVSTTIRRAEWNPTTVLRGDPAETVGELKAQPGRELQIHGSARLANALLSAGLVDTIRLVIAPTVLGSGRRLLTHPGPSSGLRLVHQATTEPGLLVVEYETDGDAPLAAYDGVTALTQQGRTPSSSISGAAK